MNVCNRLAIAIIVISIGACSNDIEQAAGDGQANQNRFEVSEIAIRDLRDIVPAVGEVRLSDEHIVGIEVSGVITEIEVEVGDTVAAGDTLMTLDNAPFEAALRREEAALAIARADLQIAEILVRERQRAQTRAESLADRGHIANSALEDRRDAVAQAQASLTRARALVDQAEARLEDARINLNRTIIAAPIAGSVITIGVGEGETVNANFETPTALTIASSDGQFRIVASVRERDISRLRTGMLANVTIQAFPNDSINGRVTRIGTNPIRRGRVISYEVEIALRPTSLQILNGMTASVELVNSNATAALSAPIEALYFFPADYVPELSEEELSRLNETRGPLDEDPLLRWAQLVGWETGRMIREGKRQIFILADDGNYRDVEIRVGAETEEFFEIISDEVAAGDQIILSANE